MGCKLKLNPPEVNMSVREEEEEEGGGDVSIIYVLQALLHCFAFPS